jgi:hypothetical protein
MKRIIGIPASAQFFVNAPENGQLISEFLWTKPKQAQKTQ